MIDTNGDGHLDDAPVVPTVAATQPSPTNTLTVFALVKVLLDAKDGPPMVHLGFSFRHSTRTLNAGTDGWFEGNVDVGGLKTRCLLADKNGDGTFDTQSPDPSQCDLIVFQVGSNLTAHAVGQYVMLEKDLYRLKISRDSNSIVVSVSPAPQVPCGWIRVPKNIIALRVQGENGSFILHPERGQAKLPVGTYRLDYWQIERSDPEGTSWTLQGSPSSASAPFNVASGGATRLRIGGPIQARLGQNYKTGVNWNFREPTLVGRSGETVSVSSKEVFALMRLRIRNDRGDYDRTFNFEYG